MIMVISSMSINHHGHRIVARFDGEGTVGPWRGAKQAKGRKRNGRKGRKIMILEHYMRPQYAT